jgi:hypothetical protein
MVLDGVDIETERLVRRKRGVDWNVNPRYASSNPGLFY